MESNENNILPVVDIGIYSRPCFGERVNGHWAYVTHIKDKVFIAILDGTGHGPKAKNVISIAKEIIKEHRRDTLVQDVKQLHEKLNNTLGAALALSILDLKNLELEYTGVGNTRFKKLGSTQARLVSVEGVVGIRMRNPILQRIDLEEGDILLFYTDGVSEITDIKMIPNMEEHTASYTAKMIVQTFGSQFDDSTCIVIKLNHAS
jgi:serine phosphatase RsbU (regulator of sigma subunit)